MSCNGLKLWLLISGMALSLCLGFSGVKAQSSLQQSAPSGAPPKLAEEQFKNIQTLKGIPADQVVPSMQFIGASLGVECEYCHVHGAMEKDDKKPKVTARKMIAMMMAINKDNFEGRREVTCFSCHRATKDPVATPIISDEEAKPGNGEAKQLGEAKPVLPAADQLLDKYLAALGGADALQKISTRVQKGTVTAFGGERFPVEIYSKGPDKRLSIMHLKGGDSITAFDGNQGWLGVPGRTHMMSAAESAAARMDADLTFAAHLKTMFARFRVDAGEKIDGQETFLVVGRNEGQPPLQLYFDRQSGLLLRLVRYAETPLGRNPTQIDYADYRDAGRVKLPFRWTLARPGNRFTIQINQIQQNIPVDDAKFVAPPPAPPGPAPKPPAP
ncbi:MAG: photosynthetic reaction center cytochrome c subunit family protein [Candidatus Acidiferrum sp.]